ncbi:MAG: hypothetical protein CMB15_00645 [Euryarchaeota archaeon]|nr:hypothetical protein [Euryarchaeota archaeon]|tara:strand:+ start:5024 stop:5512 length:489 start_codon:yes stop_codon:yes gene_type:complete
MKVITLYCLRNNFDKNQRMIEIISAIRMYMSTDEEVPISDNNSEIPWANPTMNSNTPVQVGGVQISGQFTQTNATLALILSSLGAILLFVFPPISLCFTIPGVILAHGAASITKNQSGHPDSGMTLAAQIIGWIVTVLVILGFIVVLVFIGGLGLLGLSIGS